MHEMLFFFFSKFLFQDFDTARKWKKETHGGVLHALISPNICFDVGLGKFLI